jgi:hypothetical protein
MSMPDTAGDAADVAMKTMSSANLIGHIIERRLEYLIGTLLAYQMGLLDALVTGAGQCIP